MRSSVALLVLAVAALLEAGGDALVRAGMHSPMLTRRVLLILAGSLTLSAYGATVNTPSWDFGRLLGVYVAILFVVAQLIAWIGFRQKPTPTLLFGGVLIMAGGYIVSLSK